MASAERGQIYEGLVAADKDHLVLLSRSTKKPLGTVVQRSTDGGQTWERIFFDESRENEWTDVVYPSPDVIVVSGQHREFLTAEGGTVRYKYTGQISVSSDGGQTWSRTLLDSNTRVTTCAMFDASHGALIKTRVGNVNNPDGVGPSEFLTTDDGWRTWSVAPAALERHRFDAQVYNPAPSVFMVQDFDFLDTRENYILKSLDGGQTWERSEPLPRSENGIGHFRSIHFFDARKALAVGEALAGNGQNARNVIASSEDGGMTWKVQSQIEGIGSRLLDVDFADADNGIAVGLGPIILRTRDGGQSWTQEYAPSHILDIPTVSLVAYPQVDVAVAAYRMSPVIRLTGRDVLLAPKFIRPNGVQPQQIENVEVAWTSIEGASSYRIQIAAQPLSVSMVDTSVYQNALVDEVTKETSIILNGLLFNHRYYTRVKALDENGESDWREARALFYTIENENTLLPPRILNPAAGADKIPTNLIIEWESVEGAIAYDLQVSENEGSFIVQEHIVLDQSDLTGTSSALSGLKTDTEYYVRMRVRTADNESEWSSSFAQHKFRTGSTSTSVEDREKREEKTVISIYPQPAVSKVFVDLHEFDMPALVSAQLFDPRGQLVLELKPRELSEGLLALEAQYLPNGRYYLQLAIDSRVIQQPVVIVR